MRNIIKYVWPYNNKSLKELARDLLPYLLPSIASGPKYKVYTAQVSQVGTDAPTTTVIYNTLGVITPARMAPGMYTFASAGLFTPGKTVLFINGHNDTATISTNLFDEDRVVIASFNNSGAPDDGLLYETTFEIRVYP